MPSTASELFTRVAQLQAIYDGAPVGLCYLDKELRFVSANRRLSLMEHTAIPDMVGHSFPSVFPDLFALYQPFLQHALDGHALQGVELAHPPRPGRRPDHVVLASFEPARDEADNVIGISIATLDTSDRKNKERALAASERRFRTIIDLNPQTPWILDKAGNIVEVGKQWEGNTGFSREETLRRGYMETVVDEDREQVWATIQNCLRTGAPMDFECRAARPDGTSFWIRVRGEAVLDDRGEVVCYYGSTDDIDELKRLRDLASRLGLPPKADASLHDFAWSMMAAFQLLRGAFAEARKQGASPEKKAS